jgi:Domain of unknown function (DUF4124)
VTGVKGFRVPESHTVLRSRGLNMSRIQVVIMTFVMAGLAAVATAETVYKWVDGSGQVHYTDLPPRQGDAKILSVYQRESGIAEESESDNGDYSEEGADTGAGPAAQAGGPTTPEPPVSEDAMAEAEADAAKAKVEQCKAAQDRYQRYIDSRRLFRETPDGKREYLTDKELTEARARAKQAVTEYCD